MMAKADFREFYGRNVRVLLLGGTVRYGILERQVLGGMPSNRLYLRLRTGGILRLQRSNVAMVEVV